MTPERYQQVDQFFAAALEQPLAARAEFLRQHCNGDDDLREQVETLLRAHDRAASFIETPPQQGLAEVFGAQELFSLAGQRVGDYLLQEEIGRGGMGVVYRATHAADTAQPPVAVKLIWPGAHDEGLLPRFRRERHILAKLDHPHIARLLADGQTEQGAPYFVMEYVAGQPITTYCAARGLALTERLRLFEQVCAAVHYAHQLSVIHRDLKPSNILVTPAQDGNGGVVKLLDFGIAKLTAHTQADDTLTTAARLKTATGAVLGTPRYMSPEQARGQTVDQRSDVFCLGAVLYEMLTGQPPFTGATSAEVFAALLEKEPESLTRWLPASPFTLELDRLVRRALAKDCQQRYQSVEELQRALQALERDSALFKRRVARVAQAWAARVTTLPRWLGFAAAGLSLMLAAGVVWKAAKTPAPLPMRELQFKTLFARNDQETIFVTAGRFSHDGQRLAFTATGAGTGEGDNLWVKPVADGPEMQLTFGRWQDSSPRWSPADDQLAFLSNRDDQLGIWTIALPNGTPKLLKRLAGKEATALRGNQRLVAWARAEPAIYYEWDYRLFRLDLATLESTLVLQADALLQEPLEFALSPDGRTLAFTAMHNKQSDIWRVAVRGGTPQRMTNDPAPDREPHWLDNERLVYNSTRAEGVQLFIATLDGSAPLRLPTGDHQCRLTDVSLRDGRLLCSERRDESDIFAVRFAPREEQKLTSEIGAEFWSSVSPDGRQLLYQALPAGQPITDPRHSLLFAKAVGARAQPVRVQQNVFEAAWSPTGARLGFLRLAGNLAQLLASDADGRAERVLVPGNVIYSAWRNSPPYNRTQPKSWSWSPDGERIAYCARQNGVANVWVVRADNAQATQLSANADAAVQPECPLWSPDGQHLAYLMQTRTPAESWSVWENQQGRPTLLFQSAAPVRLLGWTANRELLIAQVSKTVGARSQPTTVQLINLRLNENGLAAQLPIGTLTETYLNTLQIPPTGRAVAWVSLQNERSDVWFAPLGKQRLGQPQRLTSNNDPAFFLASLAWSPDGTTIYYDKQTRWRLLTMAEAFAP